MPPPVGKCGIPDSTVGVGRADCARTADCRADFFSDAKPHSAGGMRIFDFYAFLISENSKNFLFSPKKTLTFFVDGDRMDHVSEAERCPLSPQDSVPKG